MRAFWAKVEGRSDGGGDGWGGLEARELDNGEVVVMEGGANGLAAAWGFGVVEVENGFWLELVDVGKVELKRLLPRFEGG